MLFSSLGFLFRFLPIFLIIYFLVPTKAKNFVLFFGSLIFYGIGEPVFVLLMLLCIFVNYKVSLAIQELGRTDKKRTTIFVLSIIYNVGLLLFFKYGQFLCGIFNDITGAGLELPECSLPLGISFYTFQIISYVADVYRGDTRAETSFIDLGAYLAMFPQLIAGPIVVYKKVNSALKAPGARHSLADFEQGLFTFTIGLGSKVLLANRFGQIWDSLSEIGYANVSMYTAWIGILAYTLQIYFDFNGYSLMAIGMGRMLGFEFPQNFNHPYAASSVTDFWKRWHISLTNFFREYIYIPMGGNRKGAIRTYLNMLIVWAITGFWHGADWNFILWGLYYFVFLAVERLLVNRKTGWLKGLMEKLDSNKVTKNIRFVLSHVYTKVVILAGWAIFAISDLDSLKAFIVRMFVPSADGVAIAGFENFMYIWFAVGIIFATPVFAKLYDKYKKTPIGALVLLVIFWASVAQLTDSAYNPFLYFRF